MQSALYVNMQCATHGNIGMKIRMSFYRIHLTGVSNKSFDHQMSLNFPTYLNAFIRVQYINKLFTHFTPERAGNRDHGEVSGVFF